MDRGAWWAADHGITEESDNKDFSPREDYSLLNQMEADNFGSTAVSYSERCVLYSRNQNTSIGCTEQYKTLSYELNVSKQGIIPIYTMNSSI